MKEEIADLMERQPFVPFRVMLRRAESIEVANRHSLAAGSRSILIVLPEDRWKLISMCDVVGIETGEGS